MKKWWNKKRAKTRKRRRKVSNETYTFADGLFDLLFWIPELILFPLRIIFWLLKGVGKWIGDIFDIV
ncbi:hypothetical protein [Radiobacillus sp. PE A8.2]|uniref:hypothetical protein n=1 Tax=Radiobacillus sp. PE A8.2 TaxID=3380349 RepID=UPI00388F2787